MAIKATITTSFGEDRECYIRLNNVEASNHGVPAKALFRAFLSKEAFDGGSNFVAEFDVEFEADVSQLLWSQAYAELTVQNTWPDHVDV